ncbi:MAG: hypothetical protein ACMUFK_05435 [Thermoplasmatota archaeon]
MGTRGRPLRPMDHISTTFDLVKNRFIDVFLVGLEGYLFILAMQTIIVFASMMLMIPMFILLPFLIMEDVLWWAVLVIGAVMLIFALILAFLVMAASSMMVGGMTNCMLRIRSGEKPEFGDLFRYGWKRKWDLMEINVINTLLVLALVLPIYLVIFGLGIVMIIIMLPLGLCFLILVLMAILPITYSIVALQYLPFIIWMKEGSDHWSSIKKAWRLFFDNFGAFVGFGLIVALVSLAASMIPLVNILGMMMISPSIILVLLSIHEELVQREDKVTTSGP